jgi:non-specific serine/threonine protein kinase
MAGGHVEVGSRLAGYRLVRLLGRGGTGLVFEAEHLVLRRSAALKTLLPDLVDDAEYRERLLRESRTVAALDHPAVIPIYDAGDVDSVIYVAMRLVHGSDLHQHLRAEGPLDLDAALTVLEPVAGAIDAAHGAGLVHRDVKPANVLLEEGTGRVYLTDFGIAKQAHAPGLTRTGFFVGTVDYAAPEQIQGLVVGPPADVYAFGCVLYECLVGETPFGRGSLPEIARAHLFQRPPPLPAALGLPPALDAVLVRALAKSEGERYEDCRSLVTAVRSIVGRGRTRSRTARAPLPLAPRRPAMHPLPAEKSPLLGREVELDRLRELLRGADVQLLTLTGLGGTGKTRLALAAAHAVSTAYDDVTFVDLSLVSDPQAVPGAVAAALGVQEASGQVITDALAWRLADRRVLLLADSFERVRPAAAFLGGLMRDSPGLVVLATSQVPLRLPGEHQFPVEPLRVPDAARGADPAALAHEPAVRLFVERAQAVRPGFELTGDNARAVVAICARLDGLPLAIELAASRINLLPPHAILSRLEERFDLLGDQASAAPTRHRTLREAIDWTYDLLGDDERRLVARLGVFAGSWSLETADAVCGTPGSPRIGELLNALAALVDTSLVRQREGNDGEPRFEMLETIRHYARDRLDELGDADVVRERHARRYVALAEAAEPELAGAGQLAWLSRLDDEQENVWAAAAWACEHRQVELGLRIVSALARFWSLRGRGEEARRWLDLGLAASAGVPVDVVARGVFAAGYAALGHGEFDTAEQYYRQSLELAGSIGDRKGEAAALAQLAWLQAMTGRHASARQSALVALRLSEGASDAVTASGACTALAAVARSEGDEAEAVRLLERALDLRRELGDRRLIAASIVDIARADLLRRELERAGVLLDEALEHARRVDDGWTTSTALSTQGAVAAVAGDVGVAQRRFVEALELARRRGDRRLCAECLVGLAAVAGEAGDARRSARLLGAGRALRRLSDAGPSPVEAALEEILEPRLRSALGSLADVEQAAGERFDVDEMVGVALAGAV